MEYIVSANTDIGIQKSTNQDSLTVKKINTNLGKMVVAVLCDGMGGLAKGETASASVVMAFTEWIKNELPLLCEDEIEDYIIKEQWESILIQQNEKIVNYGIRNGINLGTTVTIMLLTNKRYYIMNVGDGRAYEIVSELSQITEDHTLIAREIKKGNMTYEEAQRDSQRNVLLQCVGASNEIHPDMFFGETKNNAVYMLCSDGFRHEISSDEIFKNLSPEVLWDYETMTKNSELLIDLNKQRQEKDNMSVVLVRTF